MAEHLDTGLMGENVVADYLVSQGWRIVARRWRDPAPRGLRTDIDLIASSPDGRWHFVEVKTRSGAATGDCSPESAVTPAKVRRMLHAAERYLDLHALNVEISIDLAAVLLQPLSTPRIRYYSDIAR